MGWAGVGPATAGFSLAGEVPEEANLVSFVLGASSFFIRSYYPVIHEGGVVEMRYKIFNISLLTAVLVAGCAGAPPENMEQAQGQVRQHAKQRTVNRDLAFALSRQPLTSRDLSFEDYLLGPGDVLEIIVFQVEEFTRKVRVNGNGMIMMPLLGLVDVNGKTTSGVEQLLASQLGEKYLHNPQISVFVDEYGSQQITVMGALKSPGTFGIQRPRTLLEMLSEAEGFTENVGNKIYVQSHREDPNSGQLVAKHLIIDLRQLLRGNDPDANVVLRGGDTVYVPLAGTVFVEGAVTRPGAFAMRGETTVLKAIAMAGGTRFQAKTAAQVFRQADSGEKVIDVDLEAIRSAKASDLVLQDGDVVVVKTNGFKEGVALFMIGPGRIFNGTIFY